MGPTFQTASVPVNENVLTATTFQLFCILEHLPAHETYNFEV